MPIEVPASGSAAAVGTAIKAFALVHPIGLSIAGGALLGIGGYYGIARLLRKKPAAVGEPEGAPAAA